MEKNKKRKPSVIIGALNSLANRIRAAFKKSAVYHIATSYDEAEDRLKNSVTCSAIRKVTRSDRLSGFRRAGVAAFDRSVTRAGALKLTQTLRHCTMRFYGVILLTFSLYVSLIYLIRRFGMFYSASSEYIGVSIVCALISIPLIADSKKTLGHAMLDSKAFSWMLFDFFELRYENFRDNADKIDRTSVAFIAGMALGCLTFFISPLYILLFCGVLLFLYLALVSPEASLLLCIFFVPFLSLFEHPTIALCVLVSCVFVGYVFKLLRKKRTFGFGITEAFVGIFVLVILFGGLRNASSGVSYESFVLVLLACGFFLAGNLFRTKDMIKHAARAFALSSVLCALVGVLEAFLGMAKLDWLDIELFSDISGRSVSFFENPNVLGTYLCLGAPMTLGFVHSSKGNKKARWFFGFCIMVLCTVLTWSRGAWIGMIVSLMIMLMCTKRFLKVGGCIALILPFVYSFIPQNVTDRFFSIGDLADSSTVYRLNIWRGCVNMAGEYGWGGIGVGDAAFQRLYRQFSVSGAETAYHSHSLWLHILLMLGVLGLAIFFIMIVAFAGKCFSALRYGENEDMKLILSGAMSGVVGLLVCGLFDYSFYNYRVCYVFFVLMGIACAACKSCRADTGGVYE